MNFIHRVSPHVLNIEIHSNVLLLLERHLRVHFSKTTTELVFSMLDQIVICDAAHQKWGHEAAHFIPMVMVNHHYGSLVMFFYSYFDYVLLS